jgi:hypothetical protein
MDLQLKSITAHSPDPEHIRLSLLVGLGPMENCSHYDLTLAQAAALEKQLGQVRQLIAKMNKNLAQAAKDQFRHASRN